jgi:hypothetical protein
MRALAIVVGCLLTSAAFAAGGERLSRPDPPASLPPVAPPATLVVPDLRGQAYVFAKGTLDDAGFAWQVRGSVRGYSANRVQAQSPAPGTRVLDTGAPTVTLWLAQARSYRPQGEPEDDSPFAGTEIREAARAGH